MDASRTPTTTVHGGEERATPRTRTEEGQSSSRKRRSRGALLREVPLRLEALFHRGSVSEKILAAGGGKRLETVSEEPRVYMVRNFLSASEVSHLDSLIAASRGRWRQSRTDDGCRVVASEERTSSTFSLTKFGDEKLRAIETRAAELVGCGPEKTEPLQLVAYEAGESFDLHHDTGRIVTDDPAFLETGNFTVEPAAPRRIATVFCYLNTLPEDGGGETRFPLASPPLAVRPIAGAALVWANVGTDGGPDPAAVHRADAVREPHEKFGLNVFVTDTNLSALVAGHPKWLKQGLKDSSRLSKDAGLLQELEHDAKACQVCAGTHESPPMLLCDACDKGWHIDCLDPPLDAVPPGDWFCHACSLLRPQQKQHTSTSDDDDDDQLLADDPGCPCEICGSPNPDPPMLLCDACDRGWHIKCLDPPLDVVPPGDWYCPACAARDKTQDNLDDVEDDTPCERCRGTNTTPPMLLCDACDRGWHIGCLDPPLKTVPRGDWYCPTCSVVDRS